MNSCAQSVGNCNGPMDRGQPECRDLHQPCPEATNDAVFIRYRRPLLFNWITILLLTAWVGIVAVIAESSDPGSPPSSEAAFIESLAR